MKYAPWMKWVPGSVILAAPPTQAEIILHDLKEKKRQLVDHELGKIKLQHERACLQEQFQYLQMSSEEKTSSEEDQA